MPQAEFARRAPEFGPSTVVTPTPNPSPSPAPGPCAPAADEPSSRERPVDPRAWAQARLHEQLVVPEASASRLAEMRFGERERRFINSLSDEHLSVRDALQRSSLGASKTCQFLSALWTAGLVDLEAPRSSTPAQAGVGAGSGGALEQEQRRQMAAELRRIERSDPFEALGCHMTATPDELRKSYRRLCDRFRQGLAQEASMEIAELAGEILTGLDAAWAVLSTASGRRQYRLKTWGQTHLLQAADVQAKKAGVELLFRQNYSEAAELFCSAWDLVPDNVSYLSQYGWCRFKAASLDDGRERAEAAKLIEGAVNGLPTSPTPWVVAALLARERNERGQMEARLEGARERCASEAEFTKLLRSFRLRDPV